MAYVTAPDFPIREIDWSVDSPSQDNISGWTGTRVTVTDPWHTKHSATVTLGTLQGDDNFRLIRSFLYRTRGTINTFRIYATAGAQNANTGVTLSADAAAAASSITITGAATSLLEGQYFTLNGQLCCCTADQSGSTLTFEPPLRAAATSGTIVVTSRPYALVSLTSSQRRWSVAEWRRFGVTFEVAEAILETDGTAPEGGATVGYPIGGLLLTLTKAA